MNLFPFFLFYLVFFCLFVCLCFSFGTYRHGGIPNEGSCRISFDGPGRVIAHAYLPLGNQADWGKIHFDDSEIFSEVGSVYRWGSFVIRGSQSLIYTAVHEIGHFNVVHRSRAATKYTKNVQKRQVQIVENSFFFSSVNVQIFWRSCCRCLRGY